MDWLKNWNEALDYLEQNLEEEIRLEELGRLAGCSAYHFQRMFSYLAGVPLKEYIRRRRMTRAAAALQTVHGVAPSLAKQDGVKLKAFPRIRFKFVLKGDAEMEYQIVRKEAFRIVGFRTPLPMDTEESFQVVPRF